MIKTAQQMNWIDFMHTPLDHKCCQQMGLTDQTIGECKKALCYEGVECSCDEFDSVKQTLCGTDGKMESY